MREYAAILLPNWVRFDLGEPIKGPLDQAITRMLEDLPSATASRVRPYLYQQLFGMLTQLSSAGCSAVFMPAENPATASSFPLFAIRPADFVVDGEEMDPMDYLIGLVGSGQAMLIEPTGMVGIRRQTDRDTTAALREGVSNLPAELAGALDGGARAKVAQSTRLSREIEYVIGVPDTGDQWMAVTASISVVSGEGSDELLDAVTEFADRWVETIGWAEEETNV